MGARSLNILRARDISLSGLGVHAPHGFEHRDLENELELLITLPGQQSFLARGRVRHRNQDSTPGFFGVEFTELDPEHRNALRSFIRHLAEEYPETES